MRHVFCCNGRGFTWRQPLKIQDCIPVGCVPPARWPYLGGVLSPRGGVPAQGGVPAWGEYLPRGVPGQGEVPAQGGVCPWGSTCPGGVPAWGEYLPGGCLPRGVPAQVLPPVNRILDTRLWKYYLAGGKHYAQWEMLRLISLQLNITIYFRKYTSSTPILNVC